MPTCCETSIGVVALRCSRAVGPQIETFDFQKTMKKHMMFVFVSSENPASFFRFIFHVDQTRLKLGSESLQELAKITQDAQQLPIWGQHGANMGPTWGPREAPRGPKDLVLVGLRPESPSGLSMDPKWTPNGTQIGFIFGSCWGHLGAMLGS